MTKSVYQVSSTLAVFILPVPKSELSTTYPFNRINGLDESHTMAYVRGYVGVFGSETLVYFFHEDMTVVSKTATAKELYEKGFKQADPDRFGLTVGGLCVSHLPSKGLGVVMSDIKKLVRGERHRLAIRCDELLEKQARQQAAAEKLQKQLLFGAAYGNPNAFKEAALGSPREEAAKILFNQPGATTHRFSASAGPNIQEVPKTPVFIGEIAFGGSAKRFSSDAFVGYDAGIPGEDRSVHYSPAANLVRRGTAKTFSVSKAPKTAPAKSKRAKPASSAKATPSKKTKTK